jgi:predicted transcriptional regulator
VNVERELVKVTSVRLSDDLAAQLDQLAAITERPRSSHIVEAIQRYLDEEAREAAIIAERLARYDSGNAVVIPHEEVMAELDEWIGAKAGDESSLAG